MIEAFDRFMTEQESNLFEPARHHVAADAKKISRISDLPLPVQNALETSLDAMADADGSYQVGCVVEHTKIKIDPRINASTSKGQSSPVVKPLHRLIFAAAIDDGKHVIVHYESGGFMHAFSLRLYETETGGLIWGSYVPEKFFEPEKAYAYIVENFDS